MERMGDAAHYPNLDKFGLKARLRSDMIGEKGLSPFHNSVHSDCQRGKQQGLLHNFYR
jgi:hypothetical protein